VKRLDNLSNFYYFCPLKTKKRPLMNSIENELQSSDSYVPPKVQVTDIIIEQNILSGGSGLLDGFGGANW